jgi:hypothetical protein
MILDRGNDLEVIVEADSTSFGSSSPSSCVESYHSNSSALFSDTNSVIILSEMSQTTGDILSLNSIVPHMFGMPHASFVGKNVRILMPEPISSCHDELVHANPETDKPTF